MAIKMAILAIVVIFWFLLGKLTDPIRKNGYELNVVKLLSDFFT